MFKRKCSTCGEKLDKSFSFCPNCGHNAKKESDDKNFGLLGKDDEISDLHDIGTRMPFGLNTIFNTLLKQVDKQFRELDKEMGKDVEKMKQPNFRGKGLSISISTATGKKPEIRVRGLGPGFKNLNVKEIQGKPAETKERKIKMPEISEKKAKQLAKLPREEAETKVRRLSNKVIYEMNLPGVKKASDIVINKLENSIEIKAFSKDKVYFKLLPVKLPIINYKLNKEKLILELKTK